MKNDAQTRHWRRVNYDLILLVTAFSLLSLGMGIIFTSSTLMAQSHYGDAFYFIKRQGIYAFLGLGALLVGRKINYHFTSAGSIPFLF